MNQRNELLKMYEGLRVTDVNDGMDAVGLQNIGIMDRDIKPLWRDIDNFSHRIYGFAVTVRYLPANTALKTSSPEDWTEKMAQWYRDLAPEKFKEVIQDGDVLVMDCSTATDVGFIGSQNAFGWYNQGVRGVVTNGGARDTDELIKQKIPVYNQFPGRGIRPGRIIYDAHNIPVNVGGVLVNPGDIIVADGDGVICVPIEKAEEVARIARKIQEGDQQTRREHYKKAGLEMDFTVQ